MNAAPVPLPLTPAQMAQQTDLALRMLRMAALGTPRVDSEDPSAPQLLTLHALITAYLALAAATPEVAAVASTLAMDIGHELALVAEQHAHTAH